MGNVGRRLLGLLALLLCIPCAMRGQEGGGQAEIGFQQYYLRIGSERVANISGLALNYSQFIPDVGLLSAGFAPALSDNRFQTGDNYLRLRGLPWKGQHWTFDVGDFRLPGQLVQVPFSNVYFPQIAGRGVWVDATHGGRSIGFFYGTGTIANTPRVVLRLAVPQTITGLYVLQKVGHRLELGARFMRFSNDLAALQSMPYLLAQGGNLKSANTLSVDALYRVVGQLKLYSEGAWSTSQQEVSTPGTRRVPFSTLTGLLADSKRLTLRANYTFQNEAYFPLLGYYLGDRQGPFGELTVRPFRILEVYGSVSGYQNNVAHDRYLPTFRNSTESAGVSLQLPARVSLNWQLMKLDLSTRQDAESPQQKSESRQQTLTLSRQFARHNIRLTARDFNQVSPLNPQRQRSAEIADNFQIRNLALGAGLRVQNLHTDESRMTFYYHGSAQFHTKRVTLYTNLDIGSDLQNRTLFATNTISTTIIGGNLTLGRGWDVQAEAYRNSLITELNPQNIFVLQGQGVFIPGTLSAMNQWSTYFRITRKLNWGRAGAATDLIQYAIAQAPLKGSIEGHVMELAETSRPAEGIAVNLDQDRSTTTDATGLYHFADVAEGTHKVSLATEELLADFDPGPNKERLVAVYPNKLARGDLDVVKLGSIQGKVIGPAGIPVDNIVVRMPGTERYTTPDMAGNFYFYNLRAGEYSIAVDPKSLPEYAILDKPDSISVPVSGGQPTQTPSFHFAIHTPQKTVRKVFENTVQQQVLPPAEPKPSSPPGIGSPAPGQPSPSGPQLPAHQPTPSTNNMAAAMRHNQLGRQLTGAGRYKEAIAELTQAIQIAPGFALAYNARGYARYLLHDYAEAIKDFSVAIDLDSGYANAYQLRGLARKASGDIQGAASDLRRAKELAR